MTEPADGGGPGKDRRRDPGTARGGPGGNEEGDVDGDGDDGPTWSRDERVELGVELLANAEEESLPIAEAVDRIETVTTAPALTREILDEAEKRGIVDREEGRLRVRTGGTFVRFERQVLTREGEFECRRCGAGLSTGHFVRFEAGELGPFGSSCVRKVTGRE